MSHLCELCLRTYCARKTKRTKQGHNCSSYHDSIVGFVLFCATLVHDVGGEQEGKYIMWCTCELVTRVGYMVYNTYSDVEVDSSITVIDIINARHGGDRVDSDLHTGQEYTLGAPIPQARNNNPNQTA